MENGNVTQPGQAVSDPPDANHAASDVRRLSTFEVSRAGFLVIVAVLYVAFDLYVVYGTPRWLTALPGIPHGTATRWHGNLTDEYRLLAVLHGELTLLLFVVFLLPRRRWLRLAWGSFVFALVWLAVARIVEENFLFQPSTLKLLSVSLLMVVSFCMPCAVVFSIYRLRSEKRLVMLHRTPIVTTRPQFGIRHLLMITTCCSIIALASRPIFSMGLADPFSLPFNPPETTVLSMLFLFPGLAAGPLALLINRPSWRLLLIVPWFLTLGIAEMFLVAWVDSSPMTIQGTADVVSAASSIALGYVELALAVVAVCLVARIGGLRLVHCTG